MASVHRNSSNNSGDRIICLSIFSAESLRCRINSYTIFRSMNLIATYAMMWCLTNTKQKFNWKSREIERIKKRFLISFESRFAFCILKIKLSHRVAFYSQLLLGFILKKKKKVYLQFHVKIVHLWWNRENSIYWMCTVKKLAMIKPQKVRKQ